MINFYQVGGSLRDEIMGLKSKDIDYAVEAPSYDDMIGAIRDRGYAVIINEKDGKPLGMEYYTAKATKGKAAFDFVLCRKDGPYYDGRRPESVEVGTIQDDLNRRDFTINALARGEDGVILDPHNGMLDIRGRVIRCVGEAKTRFSEDGLRMLRALRFAVTKDFNLDAQIVYLLSSPLFFEPKLRGVSAERVREELYKMFSFSTYYTLQRFDHFRQFRNFVFSMDRLWLKPTLEA